MKQPDEILDEMAETFRERHEIYGDNYLMIGNVLKALFPDGIIIKTIAEHNRYHLFMMMLVKMTRLACTDIKHIDSVHDISVYGAMLKSILQEPAPQSEDELPASDSVPVDDDLPF